MDIQEENKQLVELSRQYSDVAISREEFSKKRRALLDEVDAKYNNRRYTKNELLSEIKQMKTEIVSEIKNKVKEALDFFKKS